MNTLIYKYLSKENMVEALTAFYSCTGLPVQLIDTDQTALLSIGKASSFCLEFRKHLPADRSCEKDHSQMIQKALKRREVCLSPCSAGLSQLIFPVIVKKHCLGCILCGPFLTREADDDLILSISSNWHLSFRTLLKLSDHASLLPVIPPSHITQVSRLLFYLVSGLLREDAPLTFSQTHLRQQAQIDAALLHYNNEKTDSAYPIKKENLLLSSIRSGNIEKAQAALNDLLGYLLSSCRNDSRRFKTGVIELATVMSRAAIEKGSDTAMTLAINEQLIEQILSCSSNSDICDMLLDRIRIFTKGLFLEDTASQSIRKAADYISRHFSEPITLTDVAGALHLNPSYLSTLFKQVTGSTFREYLNRVRIREARRLLSGTGKSILEVALACGFSDQSYFSKVFRRYTGMTPKQFR